MEREASPGTSAAIRPAVSVVVVSDYESGSDRGWHLLRDTLAALAKQDFDEPFEVLLSENEAIAAHLPADILTLLPGLRLITSTVTSSFALKNEALAQARAELVAVVDGDVVPHPEWLRALVRRIRSNPMAAAVSARSLHPAGGFLSRAFALLARAYLDTGTGGPTRYIASHAALYRRDVLQAHPFHAAAGPFSTRLQSEAILRDGKQLLFEPEAVVVHGYEGFQVQADIARNAGYGTVITRRLDTSLPYAWVMRLGYFAIPVIVAGKSVDCLRDCLRCYPYYGIRWFEVPALLLLGAYARLAEVPGMMRALRGDALSGTAYR